MGVSDPVIADGWNDAGMVCVDGYEGNVTFTCGVVISGRRVSDGVEEFVF